MRLCSISTGVDATGSGPRLRIDVYDLDKPGGAVLAKFISHVVNIDHSRFQMTESVLRR
jgi:hypothetical protein